MHLNGESAFRKCLSSWAAATSRSIGVLFNGDREFSRHVGGQPGRRTFGTHRRLSRGN